MDLPEALALTAAPDVDQLRADQAMLARRLADGEVKVRQAKEKGDWASADRWERAWIKLLQRYEDTSDRLNRALAATADGQQLS
jgi:hypothetical protein